MLPYYAHFIDDDQYQVIRFFELFFNTRKHTYSIEQLQKNLGLSRYKIKDIIANGTILKEEISNLKLSVDQNIVTCEDIDQSILREIITKSAKKSIKFLIFLHIVLNPKQLSDNEFQSEIGISSATYFRLKKQLKSDIGSKNINYLKEHESQLRYISFRILEYFDFFANPLLQNTLPEDFITKVNNSITYSAILLGNTPNNSQRQQTLHFAIVNFFRSIQNKHSLDENDNQSLLKLNPSHKLDLFNNHLRETWRIPQGEHLLQTRLFITFLISVQQIPLENLIVLAHHQNIINLTDSQTKLTKKIIDTEVDIDKFKNFYKQLIKINAKSISPFLIIDLLTQHNWFPEEIDNNANIKKLRHALIKTYMKDTNFGSDKVPLNYIYTQYTLNIANELFPHYYESPIYIAVDFSQQLRENYVINRLENSKRLNIHIEKSTSNKTDILISDTHDPNFENEFIWKDDPDIIDWINLDEFIQSQHEENNI